MISDFLPLYLLSSLLAYPFFFFSCFSHQSPSSLYCRSKHHQECSVLFGVGLRNTCHHHCPLWYLNVHRFCFSSESSTFPSLPQLFLIHLLETDYFLGTSQPDFLFNEFSTKPLSYYCKRQFQRNLGFYAMPKSGKENT